MGHGGDSTKVLTGGVTGPIQGFIGVHYNIDIILAVAHAPTSD